MLKKDI